MKFLSDLILTALAVAVIASCTHFDREKKARGFADAGTQHVAASEPLEKIVEYGERPPIEKEACETSDGVIKVRVDVSNRGDMAADEVAFLFVSYPDSTDERRRIKQLKAFYRVHLESMQTRQILLPVRMSDLRFYNESKGEWEFEPGTLEITVGSSAQTIEASERETTVLVN